MLESSEMINENGEEEETLHALTIEEFNLPFYMETGFIISGTACLTCIFVLTLLKVLRQG